MSIYPTPSDLPLFARRYPDVPGANVLGTSTEAAAAVAGDAARLRDACLAVLARRPMTADEVAAELGEFILSVRPRISELRRMGKVVSTGERRENRSGHSAQVWRWA